MLKTQESKLNMVNGTISYCDAMTAATAPIPAFATTLTALKAKRAAITTTAQLELQIITGIATSKKELKKSLCTSASTVAAAGFAYATSINDAELAAKFKWSYTDLFKKLDEELGPVVQNIHDDADAIILLLAPNGVTPAILTSLQNAKNAYTAKVSAPRNAIAQRKAYKTQLKQLFKETDALLKTQLDKLALQLKATEPDFYITYKNNRIIIDAGTLHSQAAGLITDSLTSAALYGVIVTVIGQTFTTTSVLDGSYNLLIPTPGIYTIVFTKAGYQTLQVVNVEVVLEQTTTLNVQLVPAP
jgi:hypothetical protein